MEAIETEKVKEIKQPDKLYQGVGHSDQNKLSNNIFLCSKTKYTRIGGESIYKR